MHAVFLYAARNPRVRRWAAIAPVVAIALLLAPCAGGLLVMSSAVAPAEWVEPASASSCGVPSVGPVADWSAEQTGNAAAIVAKGREMGVPSKGLVVGLATAMQESRLVNVGHGDTAGPDSRGLFQQRSPWGPLEVRMDPAGAAGLFFEHLLVVPGWEQMPVTQAAQTVQRSAFPGAYAQWEDDATALLAELGDTGPVSCGAPTVDGWALPLPAEHIVPPMREHHDYPAVDIGVPVGSPVYAVAGGVARTFFEDGGCGVGVAVDSGGAEWMYCHGVSQTVESGATVEAGTQIMVSGNTGASTGPHLHIQIRAGGALRCPQSLLDALAVGATPPPVEDLPAKYPCVGAT